MMGFEPSRQRGNPRRCRVVFASLFAAVGLACLGAPPAQARNEFADGFEDQLGRIVAFQVARVGGFILSGGHHHHPHPRAAYGPTLRRHDHHRPFRRPLHRATRPRYGYGASGCDYGRVVYERIERHEHGTFTVSRRLRCVDGHGTYYERRVR